MGHLADIITCAKFQDDIFRGYDFTGGRISHFPIDFCMGLTTVQRDCAACDYSHEKKTIPCENAKLNIFPLIVWWSNSSCLMNALNGDYTCVVFDIKYSAYWKWNSLTYLSSINKPTMDV